MLVCRACKEESKEVRPMSLRLAKDTARQTGAPTFYLAVDLCRECFKGLMNKINEAIDNTIPDLKEESHVGL